VNAEGPAPDEPASHVEAESPESDASAGEQPGTVEAEVEAPNLEAAGEQAPAAKTGDIPAAEPEDAADEPDAPAEAAAEPEAEAQKPEPEPEPAAEVEEPTGESGEEPAAEEAGEPVAAEAPEAEPAAEVAQPVAEPKKAKKRLPRALRRQRPKPTRERQATRKAIVRLPKPEHERGRRQERRGVVVSAAMDKTIVVKVDTVKAHPRYKKVVRRSRKFHAHDEANTAKVGDVVRIVETRPLSKLKNWRLAEVVEEAK
jgi:small subunit ribosomal protein S17